MERLQRHRPRTSAISLDFDDRRAAGLGRYAFLGRRGEAPAPQSLSAQWRSVLGVSEGAWATSHRGRAGARRDERPTEGVAPLLRARAEERSWLTAAADQERTADRLERLARADPRWRFLHSIRRDPRGPTIEHLAIGPGGVFVITTKHHPRARVWVRGNVFVVNGEQQPYVREARHGAQLAAGTLSAAAGTEVGIVALIALVDAHELTLTAAPADVSVLHHRAVLRWLLSRPEILDAATIDRLFEVARSPSLWLTAESGRRVSPARV